MIILYIFLIAIATVWGGIYGGLNLAAHKRYGISARSANKKSNPSIRIIEEYRKLPAENRPYGNIVHMLDALDTKYGVEAVDSHFDKSYHDHYVFSWSCPCYRECVYYEYHDIHKALTEIKAAIAEREHATQMASLSGGLSMVEEFTERLRQERDLITDVTKEISQ